MTSHQRAGARFILFCAAFFVFTFGLILAALIITSADVNAATLYVGGTGGGNYTTIPTVV